MRPTRGWTPYLFAAPALSVFGFAVLLPLTLTAYYSLTEWDGFGPRVFVGLQNYRDIAADELFRASFWHVTLYILATLVLEVMVGLCLAGLLAARRGGTAWFRVALFTPVMLPMVVVAVLWSFVYNPDVGLVNSLLGSLGLEQLQRVWLGEESTALWAVCVVSGWVFAGFYMTIFYAALAQIPQEVVEAARLDGAGEWSIFWKIKVPLIANATGVAVLLCVTGGFQGFDLFYVMTNGGPYNATEIPTTYLVRAVFRNGEVGYGSAMAMVLTVVVIVLGAVFNRLRTRWTGELR
ncbi:MAG: sugar ABC transporter permease [Kineosporiaceae bacterium]|nr:sugar ABC transporter permease [Kineosporiaceae bacterium]MBK7624333.1 sugar ABC transporter permease [Kineosporiaceae bacterium]MBK8075217.1 sugar ABC transporter permease [Kineosporiaceae bacterium]